MEEVITLRKSQFFQKWFNEEGEMMQDPNQQMVDENGNPIMAQPPQPPTMIDVEPTDSKADKLFPEEKDGTTPEQDLINFTNYQKLLYYKKFNSLSDLLSRLKKTIEQTTIYTTFDGVDDETQHKIINVLNSSVDSTIEQIHFFLEKGISAMNIDKTRAIFNAVVKKIDIIISNYEDLMKHVEFDEKGDVIKKDNI